MNREECLMAAKDIVCKGRPEEYGSAENNFNLIAGMWTLYTGTLIDSKDVAMMMALLKIARAKTGKNKEDNYIDIAGYAACACEIAAEMEGEEKLGF